MSRLILKGSYPQAKAYLEALGELTLEHVCSLFDHEQAPEDGCPCGNASEHEGLCWSCYHKEVVLCRTTLDGTMHFMRWKTGSRESLSPAEVVTEQHLKVALRWPSKMVK